MATLNDWYLAFDLIEDDDLRNIISNINSLMETDIINENYECLGTVGVIAADVLSRRSI